MPIINNLKNLTINKVENQEIYDYMANNDLIKDDELYFITDDSESPEINLEDIEALIEAKIAEYVVTTEGDGAAYTATVPSIKSLTAGVSFIMIPHVVSSTTSPTLNVNGLGAKNIKRRLSSISTDVQNGYTATWLAVGKPFRLVYDGMQWIVEGLEKPVAADLYDTLPIEKGGTGATDAATALTNLGGAKITYGTEDLEAGVSTLANGEVYLVYE